MHNCIDALTNPRAKFIAGETDDRLPPKMRVLALAVRGTAVDGPLKGEQLMPLSAPEFFWFAWAPFQPNTKIYENPTANGVKRHG